MPDRPAICGGLRGAIVYNALMPGTEERIIEVARMRFRFRGDADAMVLIEQRYGAFACAPEGPPPISEIAVELQSHPAEWENPSVDVRESASGLTMRAEGMHAQVDASGARATITASGPGPIDVLFRFLLATHLASRDGLLVHASAIERARGAWVFAGPSGVGKTTIATHLPGRRVCDEAVAVIANEGRVTVHSTPYWRAKPHFATVAGLVFPRQGSESAWRDLSPARATARLFGQVGPLLAGARSQALSTAAAIASAVPAAEVTLDSIDAITSWLSPRLE